MNDPMKQLGELRKHWEGDMPVICDQVNEHGDRWLVVLRDTFGNENAYRCHRYFKVGFGDNVRWEVSVDGDNCDAETVMKWFCDPCALTCRGAA